MKLKEIILQRSRWGGREFGSTTRFDDRTGYLLRRRPRSSRRPCERAARPKARIARYCIEIVSKVTVRVGILTLLTPRYGSVSVSSSIPTLKASGNLKNGREDGRKGKRSSHGISSQLRTCRVAPPCRITVTITIREVVVSIACLTSDAVFRMASANDMAPLRPAIERRASRGVSLEKSKNKIILTCKVQHVLEVSRDLGLAAEVQQKRQRVDVESAS